MNDSDNDADSENAEVVESGGRFSENIEEVFYISLPIAPSTIFSCHICSTTAQNLKTHNSLKRHFKQHHSSVIIRFECRICKFELPGVKSYTAHAAGFHSAPHRALSPIPVLAAIDSPPSPIANDRLPSPNASPLPLPISSDAISSFLSEARLRSSQQQSLASSSTLLAIPPLEPAQTNPISPCLDDGVVTYHPPGLLVNFGPREVSLPANSSPQPVADSSTPTRHNPPIDGDTLWTWSGTTNVLYDGAHPIILSGSWERGGGGRCRRPRSIPSPANDELLLARHLLLNEAPPPSLTPSTVTHTSTTTIVQHLSPQLHRSERVASPSVSDQVCSQSTSNAPPWNIQAGHFDLPPQRSHPQRSTAPSHRSTISTAVPVVQNHSPVNRAPLTSRRSEVCEPVRPSADSDSTLPDVSRPKLTDQQRQWIQTFNTLQPNDLDGLSALSLSISTAAAERKDTAPVTTQPRAAPRQGLNRAPQRRPRYDPEDASTIQKLYRLDRSKAMTHILADPSPYCASDTKTIETHLTTMFAGTDHPWSAPPSCVPAFDQPTTPDEHAFLTAPITPLEVSTRLQRMKNTAPGPDGARYSGLRRVDPGCHTLALIYSRCLSSAKVPAAWKESTTVLIFKAGDRENLGNWRPLTLGNTIAKLYSGVIADRISRWAEEGKRISPQQKGFTRHDGCLEHNFLLQSAINQARRTGQELCVAWLDLANAFPSVPHSHIFGTLNLLGLPTETINVIQDLYTATTTRGMTSNGLTDPIPILSGVKQGCPLSPVVFDLAMEPIIRSITALKPLSFKLGLVDLSVLAFADDLALLAKNEDALQRQLDAAAEAADWCGLTFKPPKCATLHLVRRKTVDTVFTIEENPLAVLGEGQHYRHLGVPTGFRNKQTPEETLANLSNDLDLLEKSLLAPWQKIDAVVTFLVPRLDFILRGANVAVKPLKNLDKRMKKYVKKWLNLPQRASAEIVYIPSPLGGAGILPFSDMRNVCAVTHGFRLLTCPDNDVREIAWDTLKTAVQLKIKRVPDVTDIASYLNGSTDGDMCQTNSDVPSLWSRVRMCTRALRRTVDIAWWWCGTLGEIQLMIPRPGKDPNVARAHPAARRQVCNLLKTGLRTSYLHRLLKKPDQGKVFSVTSLRSESNHMIKSGLYTRFADWRFLHRARLDTMPLNGTRRFGTASKRCRRCNHILETLPHVLSHCKYVSRPRALRHHAIAHRLAKGTPAITGITSEDRKIPGTSGQLRPDLVVTNAATRSITIIDVAVVFENEYEAFQQARAGKIQKYQLLAEEVRSQGWDVYLNAFIVGALGGWDPDNDTVIRQLRISKTYAKLMKKLIVSDTIRWSRDIYVEFISGKRQYRDDVPLNPLPVHPQPAHGPDMRPEEQ